MAMNVAEEDFGLIEEGEVVLWEASSPSDERRRRWLRAAKFVLAGVALLAVVVAVQRPKEFSPVEADVPDSVGLVGGMEFVAAMAEGVSTAASLVKDAQGGQKDALHAWAALTKPGTDAREEVLHEHISLNETHRLQRLHGEQLLGHDADHDGNPCPDDEEAFEGLCYQKCSVLTEGHYPIRTTAFACCMQQPCSFFNSHFSNPIKLCSGLDISGKKEGGVCPHLPGDCLENEEFHLGNCYKKCAVLTDGRYPFRSGADSCCRYHNHLACFDALNVMSNVTYSVGGGDGDEKLAKAYGKTHLPIPELAEAQTIV